jgi:D-alanyl-D-alanine-carboxypeptidase/D-alanyl-D-alanine-endopeptidase
MRSSIAVRALCLAAAVLAVPMTAQEDPLRAALVNRIDVGRRGTGAVIGRLGPDGRRAFTVYGRLAADGPTPGADTIFEIGSITKVFTALVLADMVERGEVTFETPVSQLLPGVAVPSRNGRAITLADLTTHTSGLPRLPTNLDATSLENPYARYRAADLYAFLAGHALSRDPGAHWEYSNLGAGLLGHALSMKAGVSYEELLRRRVLTPLAMADTTITIAPGQRARMATAHDGEGRPVAWWDFDALAGAGGVRSTAADMLTFAAAAMGGDTPLEAAFARMTALRRPTGQAMTKQLAGWIAMPAADVELLAHDGGTAGFRSALMIDVAGKRAAVAWINGSEDVTDLAGHAVDARIPLRTLSAPRAETALDAETLETYVGAYPLSPAFVLTVTREGTRLFVQATGQPRFEVFAETRDAFFLKVVDARLTFSRNEAGAVTGLVLHQNGASQPAPRRR